MRSTHPFAAVLVAAAFGLTLAWAAPIRAAPEPPRPEGTALGMGIPPFVPEEAYDQSLQAWAEAMEAWAGALSDPELSLDATLSALWLRRWTLREEGMGPRFASLARRYGRNPFAASAWLEACRAYVTPPTGQKPDVAEVLEAREAIERVSAWRKARIPPDASPKVEFRWMRVVRHVDRWFRPTLIRVLEAEGKRTDAARETEEMASDRAWTTRWGFAVADLQKKAARQYALAGEKARARRAIDRAIELARDERAEAEYAYWRLMLRHDLLDTSADPTLVGGWPGDSFTEDAYAMLRGLRGNPHARTFPMSLGSSAFANGQLEAALGFYLEALKDPDLLDAAREDATIAGGLLVGHTVAVHLGRFDDAERILEVVARAGNFDAAALDSARARLEWMRENHRRWEEHSRKAQEPPPPEEETPKPERPRTVSARLPPAEPDDPVERDLGRGESDDASPPLWPWAAGVGLVLLLLAVARVRRP